MWRWFSRLLLAAWFIGMVAVAVLNRDVVAQGDSMNRRYFPLMHNAYDLAVRDYVGLVRKGGDFYTVRGDNSGWQPLILNQSIPFYSGVLWSPDGHYFLSQGENRVSLVPLATRVPRPILEGVAIHGASWTTDSQRVAFLSNSALYIWDIPGERLTTFPIVGVPATSQVQPVWTPDQRGLAWVRYGNEDDQVFVWAGEGTEPRSVYIGPLSSFYLYWSPDGARLMFSGFVDEQDAVYTTTATGDAATVFLSGYRVHGWVDSGNRLLVSRVNGESGLYLVQADGSLPTYFSQYAEVVALSPDGNQVLYGDFYYNSFIQATDSLTASDVSGCQGVSFQWRMDSLKFACDSDNIADRGIGTHVGDVAGTPPQSRFLHQYMSPKFIRNSTHYLALNRSVGYPASYDRSFLYNFNTGGFKQIQYPGDDSFPVLEWRYMP